uniref:Uncharacterized protein n=1 Tax=Tanacetum cinerariifolium TaxID=118510 RepID=A0A699V660_TANCI|nr:hypothetical protein [Tanacetum cinerariifolium]
MNTPSEETPRVKPSGSAGSKNRQISIGIKTSGKSSGEEVNSVPNYLRASTGSCHDISRSNAGVKKKEIKIVKKAEATRKTCPAKKLIPKATLTD